MKIAYMVPYKDGFLLCEVFLYYPTWPMFNNISNDEQKEIWIIDMSKHLMITSGLHFLFFPALRFIPHDPPPPKKKTHIPYIDKASIECPF